MSLHGANIDFSLNPPVSNGGYEYIKQNVYVNNC